MSPDLPLLGPHGASTSPGAFVPIEFDRPGWSRAQWFAVLWAYRRSSALVFGAGLVLTFAVMAWWPRTYTASVSLMVNYEVNDPLNGKELPVGQVGTYIATQVELMQTPELLLAVVDRLDLTRQEDYAKGYRPGVGSLREWAAAQLEKQLTVAPSQRGSQLIFITGAASDPAQAALIANTVAEVYKAQDHQRSTGAPGERAARYTEQLQALKGKVDRAQSEISAFNQRHQLIDEGNRSNLDASLQVTLDERLLAAQTARRAAEARTAGDSAVSGQVLSSAETQGLKAQLAAQEMRLAQLSRNYASKHPAVIDAQLQIDETRRALAVALKSYADNAASELQISQRLERNMQGAVADHRSRLLAKSQLQDESAKYLLELESAQTVYKRALEGYDRVMFASAGHDANVSVVSRALPPTKPSKPKMLTGLLLGTIASALLALGLPLLRESAQPRLRCRDDLEREFGLPVLAEFLRLPSGLRT